MWKKILYFGLAIIIGILIFIISYSSNQMNHLEGIVKDAIENERFWEVPMVWDGCFDTKSIVKNDQEKMDIVVYPATSQTDITYGTESTKYIKYEKAYYLYIFNAKFSYENINSSSGPSNKTAIVFSNEDSSSSYTYYFTVSETLNSSSYVAEPKSKEEALLNNARDITNTNAIWNFMRVTFTETMLDEIKETLGGDIANLSVTDSDGISQYSTKVEMDFSQKFFTDVQVLLNNYNIYLDEYHAAGDDKDKVNAAADKFQEFYQPWYDEFNEKKEETGYTFRYDNSYLTPSSLMWQTIGMLALYLLVVVILYILLFHFKAVRNLFSKDNYKRYNKESRVLVNGKWVKNTKDTPKDDSEVKPDVVADESLETVTASEMTSSELEQQVVEAEFSEKGEEDDAQN